MAKFSKGSTVRALRSVQGMVAGQEYTVVEVYEACTFAGTFVTYEVRSAEGVLLGVQNGHLLLAEV